MTDSFEDEPAAITPKIKDPTIIYDGEFEEYHAYLEIVERTQACGSPVEALSITIKDFENVLVFSNSIKSPAIPILTDNLIKDPKSLAEFLRDGFKCLKEINIELLEGNNSITLKCSHSSKLRTWEFSITLNQESVCDISRLDQLVSNLKNRQNLLWEEVEKKFDEFNEKIDEGFLYLFFPL